jgi:hypothetical protein
VILQDLASGGDPVVDQGGGGLGGLVLGAGRQGRDAELLGVGVEDVGVQGLAGDGAHHQHNAVFLDRLDEGLDAWQLDVAQQRHQLLVELGSDAAGAPVGDQSPLVHRAKVAPGGHVLRLEVKADAQRLQHAAADVESQRVVAKEGQVGRATARRDAGAHRHGQPQLSAGGQCVEVGRVSRFQLGLAIFLAGQSPQPIQHQLHDLGLGRNVQGFHQFKICHSSLSK